MLSGTLKTLFAVTENLSGIKSQPEFFGNYKMRLAILKIKSKLPAASTMAMYATSTPRSNSSLPILVAESLVLKNMISLRPKQTKNKMYRLNFNLISSQQPADTYCKKTV
jgi:hypothetical protein